LVALTNSEAGIRRSPGMGVLRQAKPGADERGAEELAQRVGLGVARGRCHRVVRIRWLGAGRGL